MNFINFAYEQQKIVTDGLILNLDAGNISSYSGTGSTWYDLSNKSNNASLINSPIFTSVNNNGSYFNLNGAESILIPAYFNSHLNHHKILHTIAKRNWMQLKLAPSHNLKDFLISASDFCLLVILV